MNGARQLYISTYSRIDSINHLIKNGLMKQRCRKYWNSTMINEMSLAVVFAYDMYLKVEEGELAQTWKYNNIFDLWKICDLISNNTINYNPTRCKYIGDANIISFSQHNQAEIYKRKDVARGEIGRSLAEDVQLSKFSKKTGISEVTIHVYMVISHI